MAVLKSQGLNVVSLFDGMACGLEALKRAEIPVNNYYAAEIDKYAITIAKKNHPEIIHLGDVQNWRNWNLPKIDLVIGGSPCQGFSFAGKQLAFDDPRSALFFTYCEILADCGQRNPDIKFLLENVKMKKEHLTMITACLGVEPEFINSALVSAQNRQRYYWTNWDIKQPEDKGIKLADILETDPDAEYTYMSERFVQRQQGRKCLVDNFDRKASNLSAGEYVKNGRQGDYIKCGQMVGRKINPLTGKRDDYNPDLKAVQRLELREDDKTGALTTVRKDNYVATSDRYRKLTPIECERLQTLPDNYTEGVSNTQRYKMLGNGWTVDVIAHIFRQI